MRYIIIGAGAVGGTIGARLHESGRDVVLVARGAHFRALHERGLTFGAPDGTRTLPVPAVSGPEELELRPDDVLVLAVKTQDTAAALAAWAPRPVAGGGTASERLAVVCAQNGVENERLALRRFREVLAVCVWMPSTHLEPGRVSAGGTPVGGVLRIGAYPAGDGGGRAARIAADLERAGFSAPVEADVMAWKYTKLLGNLGNALNAVAGPYEGELRRGLYRRLMAEGTAVLAAAGIAHHDPEEMVRLVDATLRIEPVEGAPRGGSSTWQSLARGAGSIETDYLNGEIVLLGRLHGVPTPANEAFQRLTDEFARTGRAPGGLTDEELAAI
ncbi:2-dehydropantoate 2-reductase [Streptomyces sp. SP17BM10]|uniref:ketopantoate reductase family protein n=1 Tax=Streptomyces sp. SP17BM10 TaxID=3002530 RepID=UPI002E779F2B|nr:2-dehydropantoate 2-reductase [Streptomyces sp. SP17BM10]MEE1785479.1 2-dehydropantoate 2-reductase [Streptomyces sp. SP17BM10]